MLPLLPKYFLHLTDASRTKLQDDIDEFSDSYYWDLDLEGLKQVCIVFLIETIQ
jgi:DNA ligase-4